MAQKTDKEIEEDLEKMWERIKAKDPQWALRQELGRMLLQQYETLTPQELVRYNELKSLLKEK